ncbi:MAG: glycerol-3-phosphate dehydrogenase [Proteobacteria bacterium]|nr:MAG: glycerol-3-phosphate dehydrogenase [Pseudomonadota bacterium]
MTAHDSVDILIVGGGIHGAGIARDAAGRGLKVALVEQADLASGTSCASTKLIHGGLRYLETFELRLVRESLRERARLLDIAPHLVQPMRFVLPHVPSQRPRWMIRAGLFLYDRLGGRGRLPGSRGVKLAGTARGAGLKGGLRHGFEYSDCRVDDARLVVLNAVDAAARGAVVYTRTEVLSATPENDRWRVICRERAAGSQFVLQARALVNAAGPWVDEVRRRIHPAPAATRMRLVKGSHIVVPRLYPGEHAFLLQHADGRVVFAIPYEQDYTLIGTTEETWQDDPADAQISTTEIQYLCGAANEYFERTISPADVRWTFAGVRALVDDPTAASLSQVTRDYQLDLHAPHGAPPLLSVLGGKLTTYRRLAEAALQRLRPHIGGSARTWTASAALPGGDLPQGDPQAWLEDAQRRWSFLPPQWTARLARSYGTRMELILGGARTVEDLGRHYGAGLTEAEVQYLRRYEWAFSAQDVLWRRSKLGLHMSAVERQAFEERFARDDRSGQSRATTGGAPPPPPRA